MTHPRNPSNPMADARALAHSVTGQCICSAIDEVAGVPEKQHRHLPECDRATAILESALRTARNDGIEAAAIFAEREIGSQYWAADIRALKDRP